MADDDYELQGLCNGHCPFCRTSYILSHVITNGLSMEFDTGPNILKTVHVVVDRFGFSAACPRLQLSDIIKNECT